MAITAEQLVTELARSGRQGVSGEVGSGQRGATWIDRAVSRVRRWHRLARQRRALAQLSDQILKDIGLSRVDALREAARPFWDEPVPWRKQQR